MTDKILGKGVAQPERVILVAPIMRLLQQAASSTAQATRYAIRQPEGFSCHINQLNTAPQPPTAADTGGNLEWIPSTVINFLNLPIRALRCFAGEVVVLKRRQDAGD
jgi:hypothetical protein